jgi:hypothetical protein
VSLSWAPLRAESRVNVRDQLFVTRKAQEPAPSDDGAIDVDRQLMPLAGDERHGQPESILQQVRHPGGRREGGFSGRAVTNNDAGHDRV